MRKRRSTPHRLTPSERVALRLAAQRVRLQQVRHMDTGALRLLLQEFRSVAALPALHYHFERHGELMGCTSPEEYLAAFLLHMRRPDLSYFTWLEKERTMWYALSEETGCVLQYDESSRRVISFFGTSDILQFLQIGRGWRIEVAEFDQEVFIFPW